MNPDEVDMETAEVVNSWTAEAIRQWRNAWGRQLNEALDRPRAPQMRLITDLPPVQGRRMESVIVDDALPGTISREQLDEVIESFRARSQSYNWTVENDPPPDDPPEVQTEPLVSERELREMSQEEYQLTRQSRISREAARDVFGQQRYQYTCGWCGGPAGYRRLQVFEKQTCVDCADKLRVPEDED